MPLVAGRLVLHPVKDENKKCFYEFLKKSGGESNAIFTTRQHNQCKKPGCLIVSFWHWETKTLSAKIVRFAFAISKAQIILNQKKMGTSRGPTFIGGV